MISYTCRHCGKPLLFRDRPFVKGEVIATKGVVLPDGTFPRPGDPIECIWCHMKMTYTPQMKDYNE